jgi:hypothetical protein
MIAFGFGLVHGFGFSFALRQTMQFAGTHLLTSLLSFNIGVELGQLLVLVLLIPALDLTFRYLVGERIGTIILSALVAHTGWHWMIDRWSLLRQYRFEWPAVNALFLLDLARWLFAVVLLAAIVWFVRGRRQMKTTTAAHWLLCLVLLASPAFAQGRGNAPTPMQAPADAKPFSPTLEDVPYPYPVQTMKLTMYGHDVRMAYMDVPPAGQANGRAVVLLHGMNFYGEAWASTIEVLRAGSDRVRTVHQGRHAVHALRHGVQHAQAPRNRRPPEGGDRRPFDGRHGGRALRSALSGCHRAAGPLQPDRIDRRAPSASPDPA